MDSAGDSQIPSNPYLQPQVPQDQSAIQPPQPEPPAQIPLEIPKKFPLKKILFGLISVVLIISLSLTYFLWWVPEAAAKEFVEKTSADFFEIDGKVDEVFSNFQKIKTEKTALIIFARNAIKIITKRIKNIL